MASHQLQGSLFDQSDDVRLRPLDGLRRTELGDGAWIDLLPGWLSGADALFERLATDCGFAVRPHMFRHTAATNWVRAGVDLDVVQRLLGHAALASTAVYLHARDEDKRRAVEAVAAGERYR